MAFPPNPRHGELHWDGTFCWRAIPNYREPDNPLHWVRTSAGVCQHLIMREPPPPPPAPKVVGEPSADTDPRTLPCTPDAEVTWKGASYYCSRVVDQRSGRESSKWVRTTPLTEEELQDYLPDLELSRLEKIIRAVTIGLFAGFLGVAAGPAVAGALSRVGSLADSALGSLAKSARLPDIVARLEREQRRIAGVLDNAKIATSIRALRTAHRLALATSTAYRGQVQRVYEATGQLSAQIFGRGTTVASALALVQMARADLATIAGQDPTAAQDGFLQDASKIADELERNARKYARSPASFYGWLSASILDPILERQVELGGRTAGAVNRIDGALALTTQVANQASDRLRAYQDRLDPFLSDAKLREIDQIRRTFDTEIRRPLEDVSGWWRDVWPEQATVIAENVEILGYLEPRVDTLDELVPTDIDQEAVIASRRRRVWALLLDDTIYQRSITPADVREADERTRAILDELRD